jgi:hypothetical protein
VDVLDELFSRDFVNAVYLQKQSLHNIHVKLNNKLLQALITFTNEDIKSRSDSQNLCLPFVTEGSSLEGKTVRASVAEVKNAWR